MGRKAPEVVWTPEQRAALERLLKAGNTPQKYAVRARVALLAADQVNERDRARRRGIRPSVIKWRRPVAELAQAEQTGAPGIDGVSMCAYAENLEDNLKNLAARLKAHSYRAPNVRRTYIPKAANPAKLRPLGIPTVEDRLLQAAVSLLLAPIYEADFLDCPYGF